MAMYVICIGPILEFTAAALPSCASFFFLQKTPIGMIVPPFRSFIHHANMVDNKQ